MTKDMRFMTAIRAMEGRHVLNQAQDRRLKRVKHVNRLTRVDQRHVLRSRYNNSARHVGLLAERQLNIARPRRQVDQQHVQLTPVHLTEHLLQRTHQHRTPPDHRFIRINEQANRHDRDAMRVERLYMFTIRRRWSPRDTHHPWLTGTIYIGI